MRDCHRKHVLNTSAQMEVNSCLLFYMEINITEVNELFSLTLGKVIIVPFGKYDIAEVCDMQ